MADGYYKCDRCGTFERGPLKVQFKHTHGLTDYSDEGYRKITYGHRTGDDNSGSVSRTVDLCEDCRRDLTEWLDGGDDE